MTSAQRLVLFLSWLMTFLCQTMTFISAQKFSMSFITVNATGNYLLDLGTVGFIDILVNHLPPGGSVIAKIDSSLFAPPKTTRPSSAENLSAANLATTTTTTTTTKATRTNRIQSPFYHMFLEVEYDDSLLRRDRPDPILMAKKGSLPLFDPGSYTTKQTLNADFADQEAYFTWRAYAYGTIWNVAADDQDSPDNQQAQEKKVDKAWYIRIFNSNSSIQNEANFHIRFTPTKDLMCPTGLKNNFSTPCSNNGRCVPPDADHKFNSVIDSSDHNNGICICDSNDVLEYGGRYCENPVWPLPPQDEIITVDVEEIVYFRFVVPKLSNSSGQALVKPGMEEETLDDSGVQGRNVAAVLFSLNGDSFPIMFVKRYGENGGKLLAQGPPLPTTYDLLFADRPGFFEHLPIQKVIRKNLPPGSTLYLSVFNWHTMNRRRELPKIRANIKLNVYVCGGIGEPKCPKPPSWQFNSALLFLPLVVGLLTVTVASLCIVIIARIFRPFPIREERVRNNPTLSKHEIDTYFPEFAFGVNEEEALGASGDPQCTICLSNFENGEIIRRMFCGHIYHSECVDPWLLQNSTCPRCRRSVHVEGRNPTNTPSALQRLVSRIRSAITWRGHRNHERLPTEDPDEHIESENTRAHATEESV